MMLLVVAGMTGIFAAFGPDPTSAQVRPDVVAGLAIAALLVLAASARPIARWVVAWHSARRDGRDVGVGRKLFKRFPNLAELLAALVGTHISAVLGASFSFLAMGIGWYALNIAAVLHFGGTSVWLQIPINILCYTLFCGVFGYMNTRGADSADPQS